jgi:hypothetical protein
MTDITTNPNVKWRRGKENIYGDYIVTSKCDRFQIFRSEDWYTESLAVWELRDDGKKVETYDRLRDAKDMAAMLADCD